MAWYKEWFGQEYLELYAHRDEEEAGRHVDFVIQHLPGPKPERVLDLACGAGRHSAVLRKRGYVVTGVDLSLSLLATQPRCPTTCGGDMRALPFRRDSFDWILNFFTSFGYFERERENFQVLEELVRLLRPGGRFMIDFLNKHRVLANLQEREVQEKDGRRIHIERWYDEATRRINKRMRLETTRPNAPAGPSATYLESVRAYDRDEVTIGARWAGLEVDALYGNFNGDTYHRESERLILVGHKPC